MATWSVTSDIDSLMAEESPDANFGSATALECRIVIIGGGKTSWERGIINFDLSAFPGDVADISAAKLTVDVTSRANTGEQVDFQRCTRPADWVESAVTWNDYKASTAWTTGGGDKTATDEVTTTVPAANGEMDITGFKTLVEDAINNRSNILSLIMLMDDEAASGSTRIFQFRSSEATSGKKPTLEITYAGAAGGFNMMNYG